MHSKISFIEFFEWIILYRPSVAAKIHLLEYDTNETRIMNLILCVALNFF